MNAIKKQVILCTVGTIFEWYEFTVFALMAPIFSILFFPHSSPVAAMLSTFAVFASGYIMRPLGAFFFGHLGDTYGRKYTLFVTIFSMTVATCVIGVIPVESSVATAVLVCCRLIQGFSTSGEYPGGLTLLAEEQAPKYKGLMTSFAVFGTGAGCFLGALFCTLLMHYVGYAHMLDGGWRIPFLLAAPLGLVSFWLRKNMTESQAFERLAVQHALTRAPLKTLLTQHKKTLLVMLSISVLANALLYVNLMYIGNYTSSINKITTDQVTYLYLMISLIYSLSILLSGFLSDLFDKKWIILGSCLSMVSLVYPLIVCALFQSILLQFFAQGCLAVLVGMMSGAFVSLLTDSFPTEVRYSGVSVTLNLSASLFGGTAPMVCTWLTQYMGTPRAAAYYIIFLSLIACCGLYVVVAPALKSSLSLAFFSRIFDQDQRKRDPDCTVDTCLYDDN